MTRNLAKRVKPGWAAKVLGIAHGDLPRLDHAWTKRDVHDLRQTRPDWLTDARRRHAAEREAAAAIRATELAAVLERLGYTAPDAGTLDQAILYIDPARSHLMVETRCSEDEADRAAWRRWPKSMTAEEDDVESDEDHGYA